MSVHDIYMAMPEKSVLNKDVVFDIYSNKNKLGTLKVSKGSVEWAPLEFLERIPFDRGTVRQIDA